MTDNLEHREEFKRDMADQIDEALKTLLSYSIREAGRLEEFYLAINKKKDPEGRWPYVEAYRIQAWLIKEVLFERGER